MDSVGGGCCRRGGAPRLGHGCRPVLGNGCCWAFKAQTPSLTPMLASRDDAIFPVQAGTRQLRQVNHGDCNSFSPTHFSVPLFNSETCQRIVRSSTEMTVNGHSHGKGNGTRYVSVVARFWCVAVSRAWRAGTTCRPQMDNSRLRESGTLVDSRDTLDTSECPIPLQRAINHLPLGHTRGYWARREGGQAINATGGSKPPTIQWRLA